MDIILGRGSPPTRPWMTLNGVMAVTLRYFTEFGKPAFQHITASICKCWNLCRSLLYFVVLVRCRHEESSRSLSHLLMSFLFYCSHSLWAAVGTGSSWCWCLVYKKAGGKTWSHSLTRKKTAARSVSFFQCRLTSLTRFAGIAGRLITSCNKRRPQTPPFSWSGYISNLIGLPS